MDTISLFEGEKYLKEKVLLNSIKLVLRIKMKTVEFLRIANYKNFIIFISL